MPQKKRKTRIQVAEQLVGQPKTAGYQTPPVYTWGSVIRDLPQFTFQTIRAMLWDPTIRLALAMRAAPLANAEFAYEDGVDDANQVKYTPGVKAHKPEVAEFVEAQMKHIWKNYLRHLLRDQIWGWSAVEVTGKVNQQGWVEVDELLPRHPAFTTALESRGKIVGVNFKGPSQKSGHVPLFFAESKCLWCSFMAEDGAHYGISILRGAYSPWADKWLDGCALDTRRLFHHKDAYGGVDMTYPPGTTDVARAGGVATEISNQEIAQQIAEQIRAGGVTTRPSQYNEHGKNEWDLTRATIPTSPTHIYDYPKDLDREMLRGMETPDDVLSADQSGSWDGKSIPAQAFYTGLDMWLRSKTGDVVKQLIEPLIMLNCGRPEDFEVNTKPLAVQAMEQLGASKGDNASKGQSGDNSNPFLTDQDPPARQQIGYNGQTQMSLRDRAKTEVVELLVGQGVFEAGKIVEQAREELDRRGVKRTKRRIKAKATANV